MEAPRVDGVITPAAAQPAPDVAPPAGAPSQAPALTTLADAPTVEPSGPPTGSKHRVNADAAAPAPLGATDGAHANDVEQLLDQARAVTAREAAAPAETYRPGPPAFDAAPDVTAAVLAAAAVFAPEPSEVPGTETTALAGVALQGHTVRAGSPETNGDSASRSASVSRETTPDVTAELLAHPGQDVSTAEAAHGDVGGSREPARRDVAPPPHASRPRGHVEELPRPKDTRIITVANQKGGVGKTTTTVNLAAALAMAGLEVLVLDLDPQGNASTALGIDHHADVPSVYDVLVDGRPLDEVVARVEGFEALSCAPATVDLAGAEIELVPLVARESRLNRALTTYQRARVAQGQRRLDYVFIDCPPSLGLLTVNALAAAEEVLVPIQCEYYALEGLEQLLRSVELIKAHLNPELHVSTMLLTMYDGRTRLAAQVADEVRAHFPDLVLSTTVPRSVRVSEAPSYRQTVMTYDPGSTGALSYLQAAREFARRAAPAGQEGAS